MPGLVPFLLAALLVATAGAHRGSPRFGGHDPVNTRIRSGGFDRPGRFDRFGLGRSEGLFNDPRFFNAERLHNTMLDRQQSEYPHNLWGPLSSSLGLMSSTFDPYQNNHLRGGVTANFGQPRRYKRSYGRGARLRLREPTLPYPESRVLPELRGQNSKTYLDGLISSRNLNRGRGAGSAYPPDSLDVLAPGSLGRGDHLGSLGLDRRGLSPLDGPLGRQDQFLDQGSFPNSRRLIPDLAGVNRHLLNGQVASGSAGHSNVDMWASRAGEFPLF